MKNLKFKIYNLQLKIIHSTLYILHSTVISGFTLIELLVTATIILILTGIGVASYNNFNQDQILKQAALDLKNNLRMAQNKALSGEKVCGPGACGGSTECGNETGEITLSGWEVKFLSSSYEIYGLCGETKFNLKTLFLPRDVTITYPLSPNNTIRFKAFLSDVLNPLNICLSGFNRRYKLEITGSGEIIDYGLVSTCP